MYTLCTHFSTILFIYIKIKQKTNKIYISVHILLGKNISDVQKGCISLARIKLTIYQWDVSRAYMV